MSQLPHYPRLARVFAPIRYHLSRTVPVVALSTLAVTGLLSAWSEPIENPPGGSADAPVNVSTIRQNKRGDLGVENLYLDAVAPEGNIYRAHQIVGYNDLFLRGDSSEFAAIYYSGKEHRFYTKTSVGAAAAERFTINSDGNVGIGAANPGRKLDVAGDANIGQTYLSNSDIYFTNTGHSHTGIGNTAGYAAIENAANYNTLMILGRSGGIGGGRSVSIWDRLDVNGSMYVNGQPPCLQNGANCPATAAEADTLQTVTNRGNTTSNPINVAKLNFNGVGGDSGQGLDYYGIYQEAGSWTHPYPDLRIGYHTGIKLGAHFGYGGTRFYNNSDMVTQIASIGDSDNNVRVYNDLYVGSIGGWASSVLCRSNGTNCPSSGLGGGGTVNYISKFTGSGTLGNSQIFDNGSSVGIGTASPGAGLDVRANAGRIMGNTLYFYGSGNHSDGMPYARLIESWGMRFASPDNRWVLSTAGSLLVGYQPAGTDYGSGNLLVSGNVGIGTTNPGAKLEVAGQIKITGGSPGAGKVLTSDVSGLASWVAPSVGTITGVTAGSGLTGGGTSGSVTLNIGAGSGISVAADSISIDPLYTQRRVSGTCAAGSSIRVVNEDGSVSCETNSGGTITGGGTVNYLSKFTGSGTLGNSQIFDNGSNVGIGTTNPAQKLEVVGGPTKTTGGLIIEVRTSAIGCNPPSPEEGRLWLRGSGC